MIIFSKGGALECVADDERERYEGDGWKVEEEGVARPRGHCRRENGRWRVDREAHGRRAITVSAVVWEQMRRDLEALVDRKIAAREEAE